MDKYWLGKCEVCGENTALKNGVCCNCEEKNKNDNFFTEFFNNIINKNGK